MPRKPTAPRTRLAPSGGPPREIATTHRLRPMILWALGVVRETARSARDPRYALSRLHDVHDLTLQGVGSDRVVYALPGGREVVKLTFGDESQNRHEVALWRHATAREATFLCPVLAAGEGWLVMPRAERWDEGDETPDGRTLMDFGDLSYDADDQNVGILGGHLVLLDYGTGRAPADPPRAARPRRKA